MLTWPLRPPTPCPRPPCREELSKAREDLKAAQEVAEEAKKAAEAAEAKRKALLERCGRPALRCTGWHGEGTRRRAAAVLLNATECY